MRVIKFRVWHKNAKRFLKSGDCGPDETYWFGVIDEPLKVCEMYCSEFVDYCDNVVIQQFTGIEDKNGKEIYEGDIVQLLGAPYKYTIEWQDYHWSINDFENALFYKDTFQPFTHAVQDRAEVIGNIFENPELINAVTTQ